jgi:hypothetical protein
MKKRFYSLITTSALLFCILFLFQGCEVIGGIFKAGVWTGIILVAIILGIIIFIISRFNKK